MDPVHDMNGTSSSTALANSRAYILVYIGRTINGYYVVDTSRDGTLWHVFTLTIHSDGTPPSITPQHAYSYEYDPYRIGGG